jgi:hypothetical protein
MYCLKVKYLVLIVIILACALNVSAQNNELKKLSGDYETSLKMNKVFHLPYTLIIASSLDTTIEKVQVDLYKSDHADYLKMGTVQEVIHEGALLLIVNNEVKTIRISEDSTNIGSNHLLVSNFTSIIDSSSFITSHTKDGIIHYVLTFPSSFVYSKVELDFSKKTKNLHRILATFSTSKPSEFKYLEVDYKDPDFKWRPNAGFPNTDKYIAKSTNGRYVLTDAYDSYKVF